jgi:hypothetical protein
MRYHLAMDSKAVPALVFCLLAGACRGTSPSLGHNPERGLASVLIGGRITLPTGQTRSGKMWINFEGEGDHANGETYRLTIKPGMPLLYQVEPDSYHLSPTRNIFGLQQPLLAVKIEGRTFRVPFPRDVMRKSAIVVKPRKIVSLGTLEVKVSARMPGREPEIKAWLDDSQLARRKLLEETIKQMMDPNAPNIYRNNAIAWTEALDRSLVDVTAEPEQAPLYKRPGQ